MWKCLGDLLRNLSPSGRDWLRILNFSLDGRWPMAALSQEFKKAGLVFYYFGPFSNSGKEGRLFSWTRNAFSFKLRIYWLRKEPTDFSFCVLALSIDVWISIVSIQYEEIFIAVKHKNNFFLQSPFMNNFVKISASGCSKVEPFLHFVVFVFPQM